MCNFFAQVRAVGTAQTPTPCMSTNRGRSAGWRAVRERERACNPAASLKSALFSPAAPPACPQPDALATGKDAAALRAEGVPDTLVPHKTFTGAARTGRGTGGRADAQLCYLLHPTPPLCPPHTPSPTALVPGNRPSLSLLLPELNAYTLGQLLRWAA